MTSQFRTAILKAQIPRKYKFLEALQEVFMNLAYGQSKSFNSRKFYLLFTRDFYSPKDALYNFYNDFTRLFSEAHVSPNVVPNLPFDILRKIFGGITHIGRTCYECGQTEYLLRENVFSVTVQVKNVRTLKDSFKLFTTPNRNNKMECEFCKRKSYIACTEMIKTLPNVFFVHLNRFDFDP